MRQDGQLCLQCVSGVWISHQRGVWSGLLPEHLTCTAFLHCFMTLSCAHAQLVTLPALFYVSSLLLHAFMPSRAPGHARVLKTVLTGLKHR